MTEKELDGRVEALVAELTAAPWRPALRRALAGAGAPAAGVARELEVYARAAELGVLLITPASLRALAGRLKGEGV